MDPLSKEFQEQVKHEALPIRTDLVLQQQKPGQTKIAHIPLIYVDASTRPDVVNLWREHIKYGEGDQNIRWLYLLELFTPEESSFYLDIQVQIPNRPLVRYFVQFLLIEQEELVERLSKCEEFSIMTDPDVKFKRAMEGKEKLRFTSAHLSLLNEGMMYESVAEKDRRELLKMLNQWRGLMGMKKR